MDFPFRRLMKAGISIIAVLSASGFRRSLGTGKSLSFVSGTRTDEKLATIDVSGGIYPEGGESTYLIWVAAIELLPDQEVTVQLVEQAQTSHPGKTVDELYPDESSAEKEDFTPTPALFAQLRSMPSYRDAFKLHLESSRGARMQFETASQDHGFAFSVVWDSSRPAQVRLSLHSYTIHNMENRTVGNYYVQEKLSYGDEVKFAVRA